MPNPATPTTPLHAMTREDWLRHLGRIGAAHGHFRALGARHLGLFVEEEADVLLVAFDRAERAYGETADGLPLGFEMVQDREWSLLSVMAIGQGWFRDAAVYRLFDTLADSGAFDRYRRVIFMGHGPMCGHAACAYSVAAPEAAVLASRPVASLAPGAAPFERRFRAARRLDFTQRYGFAPPLVRGARPAAIVFDPLDVYGAAHAALFRDRHTHRLSLPASGPHLDAMLTAPGGSRPLLQALAKDRPATRAALRAALTTVQRGHADYRLALVDRALAAGQTARAAVIAREAAASTGDARFSEILDTMVGPGAAPTPA